LGLAIALSTQLRILRFNARQSTMSQSSILSRESSIANQQSTITNLVNSPNQQSAICNRQCHICSARRAAVPTGVRHYRDVLGFSINYEQYDIGVMDRDEVRLLLIARTADHIGIGSAYFYVRDVDALYGELVKSGADVEGEPVSQPWGLREFIVRDPERNRLTFAQTFE
jgi:hypothetical protein